MTLPALPAEADAVSRRFRRFYAGLFDLKRALRDQDFAGLLGGRAAVGSTEDQLQPAIQLRLRRAIDEPGPAPASAPLGVSPGYVMAAVADEVLLHEVPWPGREAWAQTPLEQVLYRSRAAGDRVFQAVDMLTRRRAPDPDGVAVTILLALETGFRGRYFGTDDAGAIERAKVALYELVFGARHDGAVAIGPLLAGASEPLSARPPVRLPRLRPWLLATGAVMAAYLILSWVIWRYQVDGILENAHRVTNGARG